MGILATCSWKMDLHQLTKIFHLYMHMCMHTCVHVYVCVCVHVHFSLHNVMSYSLLITLNVMHTNDLVLELEGNKTKTKEITKIQTSKQFKYVCMRACVCVQPQGVYVCESLLAVTSDGLVGFLSFCMLPI